MLWVLSEVFYPEETGTGYYITKIAEHLAARGQVSVLCSQPTYSQAGIKAAKAETHNNIRIIRCPCVALRKRSIFAKLLRMVTITLSIFAVAVFRIRRGDRILAVTNPPTLPILATILSLLLRVPCSLLVHDVYPDIMAACGMTSRRSLMFRVLKRLNKSVLRRADSVICIGRDMLTHLNALRGTGIDKGIKVIPLWSDCQEIHPAPKSTNRILAEQNLSSKFVVLYAGNMGHPHDIETLAQIIQRVEDDKTIHFLIIGSGAKRKLLEQMVESGATNLTLLQPRPRSEQNEFLNACDLAIITLVPGMLGLAVPSRTYNLMAAAKPIIAMVAESSEVAMVVREENIGWVVTPGEVERVVCLLREEKCHWIKLDEMGKKARSVAETKYSAERIFRQFDAVFPN